MNVVVGGIQSGSIIGVGPRYPQVCRRQAGVRGNESTDRLSLIEPITGTSTMGRTDIQ